MNNSPTYLVGGGGAGGEGGKLPTFPDWPFKQGGGAGDLPIWLGRGGTDQVTHGLGVGSQVAHGPPPSPCEQSHRHK